MGAFRSHHIGPLRLVDAVPRPGSLGNYPVPIRIKGRYVKCNKNGFLTAVADTSSFTVQCVRAFA